MAYKTISIIVTDKVADHTALRAALDFANLQSAHLDINCVGIDPTRYEAMPSGTVGMMLDASIAEAENRAAELKTWVGSMADGASARVSIQTAVIPYLGFDSLAARLSRYSDLIVATKPYGKDRNPVNVAVLEAALFGTGAPVLVVPDGSDLSQPFERVLVAWNESSESFAAIRAALPALQTAKKVDIVMIDPPKHSSERSDPGGAICLMLARHNIKAEVSILAKSLPRVSETLLRFARENGNGLIVMGGYGHSRFRESILGGATRDMLENATIPLLLAH